MSQQDWMRKFDAAFVGAAQAAGIGDRARYYAPGDPVGVVCDVLVDRGFQDIGDDRAPLAGGRIVVGLQRAQVAPVPGARLALLDDAGNEVEQWRLDAPTTDSDESMMHWVVAPHA